MCGIFGAFGHQDAAKITYLGLYALQHRGEESAGIVSYDGKKSYNCREKGLVSDVFDEKKINSLKGHAAIGHIRYSTTGSSVVKNVQPLLVNHKKIPLAVAHNGNFTNTFSLSQELEKDGTIFQTTMDSELVIHLIAKSRKLDFKDKVVDALSKIKGSYSLVLMIGDRLIAARDPLGFRPLCLGRLDGAYIAASETCALDLIGAEYIRDVEPGEIIFITKRGIDSINPFPVKERAFCIFEYIYFARPDSRVFGQSVCEVRKRLGEKLAEEAPAEADFVMPIPDSGNYAALGFSHKCNLRFEAGMVRNHYVGRTFIQPSQLIRDFKVRVKLNPVKAVLKGKKAAVIEDSIVRGTTSKVRVRTLREAGADKVHMRVSCPPIKFPCYYGIDFPTKRELIAANNSVEDIRKFIGLDSLYYLSMEGMLESAGLPKSDFCTACFSGKYRIKPYKRFSKKMLE